MLEGAVIEVQSEVFTILLVEDNPGDVILVQEALKELTLPIELRVARDGVEALNYLCKEGAFMDAAVPDIIILDINLPRKGGFEVLRDIKASAEWKSIPVVVFTTSRSQKDILKTYGLGAACMITKPLGFYEFMESIKSILSSYLK